MKEEALLIWKQAKIATTGLSTFPKSSDDPLVGLVHTCRHDAQKKFYSVQKEEKKVFLGSLIYPNYVRKQTN